MQGENIKNWAKLLQKEKEEKMSEKSDRYVFETAARYLTDTDLETEFEIHFEQ